MFRPLFIALAGSLLAAPGDAQFNDSRSDGPLVVEASAPWPDGVQKGYAPLFLEITNEGDTPLTLDIEALRDSWQGDLHRVERTVSVPGGESHRVELLMPCFNSYDSNWQIEVSDGRREVNFWANGIGRYETQPLIQALVLRPATGGAAPWGEALTTQRYKVSSTETAPNARAAEITFQTMPQSYEAYTSLDWVLLDTSDGLPGDGGLAPLLRWARLGGRLVLFGTNAEALASTHPGLAPWLEPRFEVLREGRVSVHRLALGELYLAASEDLVADTAALETLKSAQSRTLSWIPNRFSARSDLLVPVIPGLEELPYSLLVLFLVAFAVLVGPVNFYIARRTGRTYLTLYSIPLLAIATSASLVGFALTFHGIGVSTASESFAILDQRSHHLDLVEVRQLYAGLSPGSGLRPGQGTACFPGYKDPTSHRRGPEYQLFYDDGLLLSGEYLPTRTSTRQLLLTDRTARARLSFALDDSPSSVTNGLGAEVAELWLRDAAGSYWTTSGLADGATSSLRRASPEEADPSIASILDPIPASHAFGQLPAASYVALLPRPAFQDDCGVESELLESHQRILGLLDPMEVTLR